MRIRLIAAAILASLISIGARPARAEDDPETLIRQGNEIRRRGDDARAYGYMKRAYDIARTPRSAAQLGLVEASLGKLAEAERHLSEALAADDPWIDQNRSTLEDSRRWNRTRLGRVELRGAPAGATVEIGGAPPTPVPPDGIVWVVPGEVKLRVAVAGREPFAKAVVAAAGASAAVDVDIPAPAIETAARPPEAPASPPGMVASAPASPDAGATKRVVGLATAGGGAAIALAGFFVYRAGANKVNTINNGAASGGYYDPSDGNWQTLADAGTAMMIAGGVAAAGGVLVYLWGRNGGAKPDGGTPSAMVGYLPGHGLGLQLSGRF